PVPTNTAFVSADNGGTYDPISKSITWNLGTQVPGSSGKVSYVATVAKPIANGTVIINVVTIDSNETDPLATSAITTATSAPKLSMTKSVNVSTFVNPGAVITYTVTVTNAADGTDAARNLVLTDTLPSGFTFAIDGTSTKSFALGNLSPGQFATVTYVVNVSNAQAAGTYENLAKAKADNATELTATAPVEVRVPVVLSSVSPELTITKTVDQKTAKPGDVLTFKVTVKNVGDGDAHNVIVTDTLPKDLSFVHGIGRTQTWKIGTLQSGRSRVINVDVRVESDAKAQDYVNVAVLSADDLPSKEARATVTIKIPRVLGLATTGAGRLDLLIAALGACLVGLGLVGLRLGREQPQRR
ncbi:MAG: DUF11 domain-containing protein, partial [Candidatus Kerfeldbacteria bacterium]|nr:DUF11 domain-containing protein [Candidatus Kerfeldbacteria bacterium]